MGFVKLGNVGLALRMELLSLTEPALEVGHMQRPLLLVKVLVPAGPANDSLLPPPGRGMVNWGDEVLAASLL